MILLQKSKNKQYYFTVIATNGKILATSETFTRRNSCLKSAKALIKILTKPTVMIKIDETISRSIAVVNGPKRKK